MQPNPLLEYIFIPSPFGEVAILYRAKPFVLEKIFLPRTDRNGLLEAIAEEGGGGPGSHPKAAWVAESLKKYFKGKPLRPRWHWLNMQRLTPLQRAVLRATADIPFGTVRSYKDLAEAIKRPRAYRFVGTTLGHNPFPILIPCHRVIRSDASLGEFGGGTELKRKLIEHEAGGLPSAVKTCR